MDGLSVIKAKPAQRDEWGVVEWGARGRPAAGFVSSQFPSPSPIGSCPGQPNGLRWLPSEAHFLGRAGPRPALVHAGLGSCRAKTL
jgi:hypothetical protein